MKASLLIFAAALVAGCGEPTRTDTILGLTGDAANGAKVWSGTCAVCHGASGEGVDGVGSALTGTTRSDEEIVDFVLNGTTGTSGAVMAPLGDVLTDQEIADVLEHVHDL